MGTTSRGTRLLLLAISVQFFVPAAAFVTSVLAERPVRFGFQMYSGRGEMPVVRTIDALGRSRVVGPEEFAAGTRSEIDWLRHLPAYLCAGQPDAVSVQLSYRKTGVVEERSCTE